MRSASVRGGQGNIDLAKGSPDRAVMARMFAYLYGLGGWLILLTLLLPHLPGRDTALIGIVAVMALSIALVFLIVFDRLPMWVFRIAPGLGATLIAVMAYAAAGPAAAAAYLFFLLWVSLSASYFFSLGEAVLNALYASAVVSVALLVADDVADVELLIVMVTGTMLVNGIVMVGLRHQLDVLLERLDRAARTDFLTRLANRREFNERFEYELARASRVRRPLSVVVFDLDSFKLVNDRYGHESGDRALAGFAELFRKGTRRIDTAARIGGEEFALLAPETGTAEAGAVADRIRAAVEESFSGESGLTVSCGVSSYPEAGTTAEELLRAADRALYAAKSSGRNRVVSYVPEVDAAPLSGPATPRAASPPKGLRS